MHKKKVLHIIPDLSMGGAEVQLLQIYARDKKVNHKIVLLRSRPVDKFGTNNDQEIYELKISSIYTLISGAIKLLKILRNESPDIIQTWMYHSDLFAGFIGAFTKQGKVFWNVRSGKAYKDILGIHTYLLVRICSFASHFIPCKIIYNSNIGANFHKSIGYSAKKTIVIPNGLFFESVPFAINKITAKKSHKNIFCIGHMGRYHPIKNLDGILDAVQKCKTHFNIRLFLAGDEYSNSNESLKIKLVQYGILNDVVLMGRVINLEDFYSQIDLFLLNSFSEGSPNVLIEAQAHAIPCISTNVIDQDLLALGGSWIIEPGKNNELYFAIQSAYKAWLIKEGWGRTKLKVYEHVRERFQYSVMINSYHEAWFPEGLNEKY